MATAKDILERKGNRVVSVAPDATVLEVARLMNAERIGAVMVVDRNGAFQGIFTERDILRRVVAESRSPAETPVRDVMTTDVVCCHLGTPVEECQSAMTDRRLRHLPVVENGELVGIISIGDILVREVHVQQQTIEYLHAYLYGRA